ncbi:MAG TPA: class I SAM-dependent methyltransferase [Bryobacteraceae bacterium]|nr:class I SAM-dependent methyltransferase [Bryobacteraceae bacterium]
MNADPLASSYRWLEYAAFGRSLERARFDYLPLAAGARRILILGEGDGRFLARLLLCNPNAHVAVVESSSRMIGLARARVPIDDRRRVDFHHIDAAAEPLPRRPFDLAVSHFFLDILTPPQAQFVIDNANAQLCPGAHWLLSEFQIPPGVMRSVHARLWLSAMYRFFAATTGLRASHLPPYRESLECLGWSEVAYCERKYGLIRSQVWRKR